MKKSQEKEIPIYILQSKDSKQSKIFILGKILQLSKNLRLTIIQCKCKLMTL